MGLLVDIATSFQRGVPWDSGFSLNDESPSVLFTKSDEHVLVDGALTFSEKQEEEISLQVPRRRSSSRNMRRTVVQYLHTAADSIVESVAPARRLVLLASTVESSRPSRPAKSFAVDLKFAGESRDLEGQKVDLKRLTSRTVVLEL